MFTRTILALSLAATTLSLGALPAQAGAHAKSTVSYGDLDVASDAGAQELRARIRRAATNMCFDNRSRSYQQLTHGFKCRAEAMANAEAQFRTVLAQARAARTQAAAE